MTDQDPTVQAAIKLVGCTWCGRGKGLMCRSPGGTTYYDFVHRDRANEAKEEILRRSKEPATETVPAYTAYENVAPETWLVKVEVVLDFRPDADTLQTILDNGQAYGAAEIVQCQRLKDSYTAAVRVLNERAANANQGD